MVSPKNSYTLFYNCSKMWIQMIFLAFFGGKHGGPPLRLWKFSSPENRIRLPKQNYLSIPTRFYECYATSLHPMKMHAGMFWPKIKGTFAFIGCKKWPILSNLLTTRWERMRLKILEKTLSFTVLTLKLCNFNNFCPLKVLKKFILFIF